MRLRFQRRALRQIDEALGYVQARSPQGAAKIRARLVANLDVLRMQPHAGVKTSIPGVRRLFLVPYPYLIDYFVGDGEIVIQRFRHTARNPAGAPPRL